MNKGKPIMIRSATLAVVTDGSSISFIIIEARKLIRLWDEIYSPDHKDTGYESKRLETAIERLRSALDGLRE